MRRASGQGVLAFIGASLALTSLLTLTLRQGPDERLGVRTARIFEPGLISTPTAQEYGVTFSPDGLYLYFTRDNGIYWSQKDAAGWSSPKLAGFSKGEWISRYLAEGVDVDYFNWDPVISPDGSKLFIMSHGLVNGRITAGEHGDWDLWVLDRIGSEFDGDSWSAPRHLGGAISAPDHDEGAAGVTRDGTLFFFSSGRPGAAGKADIYSASFVGGEYLPAENIGAPINTPSWDGHTYVDPGGSFLLFISNDLPGGFGSCDIYVSRRLENRWEEPRNLGPKVNTEKCELTPSLTPDGKSLFFARTEDPKTGLRNIYWLDLAATDF